MKIAYLILCHKEPSQVNALLEELLKDGSDCYIHIDKKSTMTNKDLLRSERVFFVSEKNRVDVRWAANSMVRATLALIGLLLSNRKQYDFVCLLSGQDFPVKSSRERLNFLEQNKGHNFIEVLSHEEYLFKRYNKRSLLYFPEFMYKPSFLSKVARKLYVFLTGGYTKTLSLCIRKNTSGVEFEYGSQWWCMTFDCIKWMNQYINQHVNVNFFDHAMTPDECFFQSVFMASPYREKRKDRIMYLEWASNDNNPRILTTDDLERLKKQENKLFARKFDINKDSNVLRLLSEK